MKDLHARNSCDALNRVTDPQMHKAVPTIEIAKSSSCKGRWSGERECPSIRNCFQATDSKRTSQSLGIGRRIHLAELNQDCQGSSVHYVFVCFPLPILYAGILYTSQIESTSRNWAQIEFKTAPKIESTSQKLVNNWTQIESKTELKTESTSQNLGLNWAQIGYKMSPNWIQHWASNWAHEAKLSPTVSPNWI